MNICRSVCCSNQLLLHDNPTILYDLDIQVKGRLRMKLRCCSESLAQRTSNINNPIEQCMDSFFAMCENDGW